MLKKVLLMVTLSLTIITFSFGAYYEDCRYMPKGSYIAVENNCRAFIYCQDAETSFEDSCPEGTFFNEEMSECAIDENNICPAEQENDESEEAENEELITIESEISIIVTTTISPMLSTSNIFEHKVNTTARPQCNRQINAYYPHSQRCEYYYKCISGFLTISRCNFNYAWDYQKELCVHFDMVKCYGNSTLGFNAIKNLNNKFHF